MPSQKLIDTLERDIRNQVRFNQMLKLSRRQKLMITVRQNSRRVAILLSAIIWVVAFLWAINAWADDLHVQCPDPGVKCKVLFLTEQEQQMLMTQNGILDTAAQGRALDLGQISVYLKTRIASAPSGQIRPTPSGSGPASNPSAQINPAEAPKPVDKP